MPVSYISSSLCTLKSFLIVQASPFSNSVSNFLNCLLSFRDHSRSAFCPFLSLQYFLPFFIRRYLPAVIIHIDTDKTNHCSCGNYPCFYIHGIIYPHFYFPVDSFSHLDSYYFSAENVCRDIKDKTYGHHCDPRGIPIQHAQKFSECQFHIQNYHKRNRAHNLKLQLF